MLDNKVILITGGTGSFGRKFTEIILKKYKPKKLIIFSRDEFKQYEMAKTFPESKYPIRYFLGDIRDRYRLGRAFEEVDYVVHAAALKQVPALEYNPTEAVRTNVDGAENIVNAAIDAGVKKVIALSTDKAVNPVNLYGATKLVSEKIFVSANAYAGKRVKFAVVRYGNVLGSRGSIIPHYQSLKDKGEKVFPITDKKMTRFIITLDQAVNLVVRAFDFSQGGEIFIPKIPSMKMTDLARAFLPECEFNIIGIRPGEKIHEILLSEDEARNTRIFDGIYTVMPQFYESKAVREYYQDCPPVAEDFVYRSDTNEEQMTVKDIRKIIYPGETANDTLCQTIN